MLVLFRIRCVEMLVDFVVISECEIRLFEKFGLVVIMMKS